MGWQVTALIVAIVLVMLFGLGAAVSRVVPADFMMPLAGCLLFALSVRTALMAWRRSGRRSPDGVRASVNLVGTLLLAVSTFFEDGALKYALPGISVVLLLGVVVEQWRASRRAAA